MEKEYVRLRELEELMFRSIAEGEMMGDFPNETTRADFMKLLDEYFELRTKLFVK